MNGVDQNSKKCYFQIKDKIAFYSGGFGTIAISNTNSSSYFCGNNQFITENNIKILKKVGFFSPPNITLLQPTTISICLEISSQCNLNCKYCFNKDRHKNELSINEIISFIDLVISIFPNAHKFHVDFSGVGEPLLNIGKILEINNHLIKKCNEIEKVILPLLVCNGTLLSKDVAKLLSDNGILYGISMDGNKKLHDKNRVDEHGSKTYSKIITNVKNIESKDYLGLAMSISQPVNLISIIKNNIEHFPTISIKPIRDSRNVYLTFQKVKQIIKEYDRLTKWLIKTTLNSETKFIFSLLNGEDYFGKFIQRVFLGQKTNLRCDAGVSRFFLSSDKNIYICPAAVNIKDLMVKDIINSSKYIQKSWNEICVKCSIRFVCGGECYVNLINNNNIPQNTMCTLNRHLFYLATIFTVKIKESGSTYNLIRSFLLDKNNRLFRDQNLHDEYQLFKHKYSFVDYKKIYDQKFQDTNKY